LNACVEDNSAIELAIESDIWFSPTY
jgi:hypothetical protein